MNRGIRKIGSDLATRNGISSEMLRRRALAQLNGACDPRKLSRRDQETLRELAQLDGSRLDSTAHAE